MVRVLVVEDSAVIRNFLVHILESDPEIEVIGTASDGIEAVEAVPRLKPSVVTMDINMPGLNGLEATRRIMERSPTPIVIVSGSRDSAEVATTFNAVEAGALTLLPRPAGIGHPDYQTQAADLVRTVKLMSEVKVVRRHARQGPAQMKMGPKPPPRDCRAGRYQGVRLVAVGASTGGPIALKTLFGALRFDFRLPIVVVQHMAEGFTEGFVEWLASTSDKNVTIAQSQMSLRAGTIYVAPNGLDMTVTGDGKVRLNADGTADGLRPSVSALFRSVAENFGPSAVGILLTGMGRDGARELGVMKAKGSLTIAQDQSSSVVYGMPGEAARLGAATCVLPLDEIARLLAAIDTEGAHDEESA